MVRKILRVLLAGLAFVFALSASSAATAVIVRRIARGTIVGEKHFFFARDIARGTQLEVDDLDVRWLPRGSPTSIRRWRPECVVGKRVLVDVKENDLVAPSLIEDAIRCVATDRPDDWLRD